MLSKISRRHAWLPVALSIGLLAAACGDDADVDATSDDDSENADGVEATSDDSGGSVRIEGAGATFPNPVFVDWIFDYSDDRADDPINSDLSIDYQSIGSGGGIEQFLSDTVDWGTSEAHLTDEELDDAAQNRDCEAFQVPIVYGSVVLAFEDDQFDEMVLDADTIGAIFQRDITNFDDERLAELNPDMDLPDQDIIPVHRSDGSGTTSVFTTYLEDAAADWELGSGTEVDWPDGTVGGDGNDGVTAGIQQNPGGVGYVNQAYAIENDLPQAQVVNDDGNAVYPTLEATTEAIEELEIPDDFQFDILGVGGEGFPITGTVWNFFYTCGYDAETADALVEFWSWATQSEEADETARELGYAPLGESLKEQVQEAIERINEND